MAGRKHQKPPRITDSAQTFLFYKNINISVSLNSNYNEYQTLWDKYGPLKQSVNYKLGHS